MTDRVSADDNIGVYDPVHGEYRSFGSGFSSKQEVYDALETDICVEVAVYIPHDMENWSPEPLDPEDTVAVYDAYGPHGFQTLGTGFNSTADVRDHIDTEFEPEGEGEYVICIVVSF